MIELVSKGRRGRWARRLTSLALFVVLPLQPGCL